MKLLRTVILIVVSLGLALPSAHALALCIDSDGSVALEVAVDGVCTGTKTQGRNDGRTAAEGLGLTVDAVDGCGGCTDVVIRGGGAAVPPPDLSVKSRHSRATDETTNPVDVLSDPRMRGANASGCCSSTLVPERPDACGFVVLRL